LWVDEKLMLDKANLTRQRNGARVDASLSEGFHSIRVEFWDTGGAAKMRLLWRAPGGGADEPVPAAALYHDAAADRVERR
jgi:hypothetical protein